MNWPDDLQCETVPEATIAVRDYMPAYNIPHWMPETCPIGFDGGGGFYLLDMRNASQPREFPVVWAHASNLGFDDARPLAKSFSEFVEKRLSE